MEELNFCKEPLKNSVSNFSSLSSDLTELILSILPVTSIVRATAVCKHWHAIITASTFSSAVAVSRKKPFFFLYGLNNIFPRNNRLLAFDPDFNNWLNVPLFRQQNDSSFSGCDGFYVCTTSSSFSFCPILSQDLRATCMLNCPRLNPLVGVFYDQGCELPKFIVVGGVKFIGGLVDIEDGLFVEIYNPQLGCWENCPPLPADFRTGNSSQSLSSASFDGKFYVYGIYSGFVSSFDLHTHVWSEVQTLRPPGILSAFMISCNELLVLAGLCNDHRGMSFNLWSIDDETMEFSELAVMPGELLACLFDGEEEYNSGSLKCVGLDNVVYVFNEEQHMNYPTCVCEISDGSKCSWRRIPDLPVALNHFHKVTSFCSSVSIDHIVN
ncbi:LOW QUALITY PROTEIN: F-box/kelch-repeat protein At3g24760 [Apium graveolens]|uniref:LOW QUALITY PROTEIN: F-box/kelch-repeat protein At3g24760 n=1 Tax=Apium graveolens TaxID=4045 RepID=UPI003D7B3353